MSKVDEGENHARVIAAPDFPVWYQVFRLLFDAAPSIGVITLVGAVIGYLYMKLTSIEITTLSLATATVVSIVYGRLIMFYRTERALADRDMYISGPCHPTWRKNVALMLLITIPLVPILS